MDPQWVITELRIQTKTGDEVEKTAKYRGWVRTERENDVQCSFEGGDDMGWDAGFTNLDIRRQTYGRF